MTARRKTRAAGRVGVSRNLDAFAHIFGYSAAKPGGDVVGTAVGKLEGAHGMDELHGESKLKLGADLIDFCEGFELGVEYYFGD